MRRSLILGAVTLGVLGLGAAPAMASGTPASTSNVDMSGSVAQAIGWQTAPASSLDFGAIVPGQTSAPQSVTWAIFSNDDLGASVTLTPGSGAPLFGKTANNTNYNGGNTPWTVNGVQPWPNAISSPPITEATYPGAVTADTTHTDTWTFTMPSAVYPDSFTESMQYTILAN